MSNRNKLREMEKITISNLTVEELWELVKTARPEIASKITKTLNDYGFTPWL